MKLIHNSMNLLIKKNLILFVVVFCAIGCKKFITIDSPVTSSNASIVFNDDATAAAVLTGIYTSLENSAAYLGGSLPSLAVFPGLSSDEFVLFSSANTLGASYYTNSLTNSTGSDYWILFYQNIYITNDAIAGLNNSNLLTPSVKKQLLGEAEFLRAFFYFQLVNLYGDVPLTISTDYEHNRLLSKSPKDSVYHQIIKDLLDAQSLLTDGYMMSDAKTLYPSSTTAERIRPNKAAATALLARVYLFTGQYDKAETLSTGVINNTTYYTLTTLNSVFLKNSKEAIWQLQPVRGLSQANTPEGFAFILPSTGPNQSSQPVYLSSYLLNAFETNDQRRIVGNWVNSVPVGSTIYYYPFKYKIGNTVAATSEYSMILRLGEQYLIRAEARAQQGNLVGAASDINVIRARASNLTTPLPQILPTTQSATLAAILHERQVELFGEIGSFRWFDLKRTQNVDAVMNTVCIAKGGVWNTNWQLYPIPLLDLQRDPNLIQNAGY